MAGDAAPSAALLLLSSLLWAISSSGIAAAEELAAGHRRDGVTNPAVTVPFTAPVPGIITVPSTNPIIIYPPAITVPATVFPPPPPPPPATGFPPVTNPVTTPYPFPPPVAAAGQSWCVARAGATEAAVQAALDYACGGGGADCTPIQPAGSCFNPNTLRDHASYAFNSYYQRNPSPVSCDFGGAAAIVYVNPSTATCIYPSTSAQAAPINTYTPTISIPSPPTGFLPTPTISIPSPPNGLLPTPTVSNPTGTGAVFGPNNPLGSANPAGVTTTSSSTALAGRASSLSAGLPLSHLTLLIGSMFISRW